MPPKRFINIGRDLAIIFLSVFVAINLAESGVIQKMAEYAEPLGFLTSFLAGIFFTSVFTVAPAGIVLYEISKVEPILIVALLGAFGALIGDSVLFHFFKDVFSEDILNLFKKSVRGKISDFLWHSYFRWVLILIGGLIISSPLPDELGLMLMGFSKANNKLFIGISLVFNFIGILIIGLIARS